MTSANINSPDQTAEAISSRPQGAGTGSGLRPMTFVGVLDAFRRRWLPALVTAIPATVLVTGLIWQSVKPTYETSTLLKLDQHQGNVVFGDDEKTTDIITYRNSQLNKIASRPILEAVTREQGVRDCPTLAKVPYPVDWLEEYLDVEQETSDEYIRISLEGTIPEDLALIVNAVKDVYLEDEVFREKTRRQKDLERQKSTFAERDAAVKKNQERIARLARELGTGDPKVANVSMQLQQESLRGLYREKQKIEALLREEESLRQNLREQGLSPDQLSSRIPGLVTDLSGAVGPLAKGPKQNQLEQQLAAVQYSIHQFQQNIVNEEHPELLALLEQEKQLKQLLSRQAATPENSGLVMSRYDWLIRQQAQLENQVESTEQQLALDGSRIVELENERADIQHLVKTRDALAEQISKSVVELSAPERVRCDHPAHVPEKPDSNKRIQLSVVGGVGTFGLVIAGFILFEWMTYRVSSSSDISSTMNLRLIGTIPSPDRSGLPGFEFLTRRVNYDEWNRAVIESMDIVRTYLMRHIDPSRSASILLTSAVTNEGKTTISCQLAASLARTGRRVAIVDCDFRRPSAHLMLDGDVTPGICEFLRGEASLQEIQQQTQADGLTFIAAGQVDQKILQQLNIDGGRRMIDQLKAEFDCVIIDTSPMLFVAEPAMMAQHADIVLLATRKDHSRIPYVAQCRELLRSLQVPLLGSIMVGADSGFQRDSYGYRQEVQQAAVVQPVTN